jgi:hypothetical protein
MMIPFLRRIGCSLSDIQSTSEITRRKDMHTQIESRLRWVAGPKQKLCFRKTEKHHKRQRHRLQFRSRYSGMVPTETKSDGSS